MPLTRGRIGGHDNERLAFAFTDDERRRNEGRVIFSLHRDDPRAQAGSAFSALQPAKEFQSRPRLQRALYAHANAMRSAFFAELFTAAA
jgi:hypothetical protein